MGRIIFIAVLALGIIVFALGGWTVKAFRWAAA